MSAAKEEARKRLEKMSRTKQAEVFEKLLKIRLSPIDETKEIFESTTEDVQEVIGLLMIDFLHESSIDEKSQELKQKDAAIREDALKILNTLIMANPNEDENILCDRAIRMAQRLHDHC